MAPTLRVLTASVLVCIAAMAVRASTPLRVAPTSTTACVWSANAPAARRCVLATSGIVNLPLPDEPTVDTLVAFTAPGYFDLVIPGREIAGKPAVALDRLPAVHWQGWLGGSPQTLMEWLPQEPSGKWQPLATEQSAAEEVVPGELQAVRLTPHVAGMSPKTVFPASARASLTIPPQELRAGGEIALCVTNRAGAAVRIVVSRDGGGNPIQGTTNANGCVSFAGLVPGRYEIRSESDDFPPQRASVRAGESSWLGAVRVPSPATINAVIADSDHRHLYTLTIRELGDTHRLDAPSKHVEADQRATWRVRPGTYEVSVHPDAYPAISMKLVVSAGDGGNVPVVFEPSFVTAWGIVKRGSALAPNAVLSFHRNDGEGRQFAVAAQATSEGRYETVLPAPGSWTVTSPSAGQRNWSVPELMAEVPLTSRYEWNIELPSGRIAGKVTDRESGAPIAGLTVDARWENDTREVMFATSQTDAEGAFAFSGLPPTEVTIEPSVAMVRMLGYKPEPAQSLKPAEDAPALLFALLHAHGTATLRITDAAGNGVAGAQVFRGGVDPMPQLVGRSDATGLVDIPNDIPLPVTVYIVATGFPWRRFTVAESRREPVEIVLPDPDPIVSQFVVTGLAAGEGVPWGLEDDLGFQVPVFFHLIRQGLSPTLRGGAATLPLAARGAYRLWIRAGGVQRRIATIVLPAQSPLVFDSSH